MGSKKGLSSKCPEGRKTPLHEYDPSCAPYKGLPGHSTGQLTGLLAGAITGHLLVKMNLS